MNSWRALKRPPVLGVMIADLIVAIARALAKGADISNIDPGLPRRSDGISPAGFKSCFQSAGAWRGAPMAG